MRIWCRPTAAVPMPAACSTSQSACLAPHTRQVYYVYGFFLLVFLILLIVTVRARCARCARCARHAFCYAAWLHLLRGLACAAHSLAQLVALPAACACNLPSCACTCPC